MQELLSAAMWTHKLFIGLLYFLAILNIYFISKEQLFSSLGKQIEFLAPQYYLLLAAILFTGLLVWTVEQFAFKIDIVIMIAVWIVIFITSIMKYKRYKKTSYRDLEAQKVFKSFAVKKYVADIILLSVAIAFAYIF